MSWSEITMTTSIPDNGAVTAPAPDAEGGHDDVVTRITRQIFADTQAASPAGAFSEHPSASHEIAPPVHPAAISTAPTLQPVESASGGHAPGSGDAHPFGEPRCYQSGQESGAKPSFPAKPLPYWGEGATSGQFYFLKGREATPALPGSSLAGHGLALPGYDVEAIRKDFPALHQKMNGRPLIWLDNAATTQKPQSVIDATSVFYSRDNSNIHRAAYELAERATRAFEGARDKVRDFIGATDSKQIVFLRGTTEAINLVAQSYGRKNIGPGDEILLTTIEHHANIVPWQLLAEQTGAVLRVAPVNDRGELILDQFATLLSGRTKIVSITHVANSIGTVNPVEQVIALAHAYGVPVLVDAAQSAPHMPLNVTALDADFLVLSGHKVFADRHWCPLWQVGAARGDAAMAGRRTHDPRRYLRQDHVPERTREIRSRNTRYCRSGRLRRCARLPARRGYARDCRVRARPARLREPRRCNLSAVCASSAPRRIKASVLSFVIPGLAPEKIAEHLDQNGIAARAGHHCALPALRRFGVEKTVRASLAFYNTQPEVDTLVRALHQLKRA